jgi:hypothetical protein
MNINNLNECSFIKNRFKYRRRINDFIIEQFDKYNIDKKIISFVLKSLHFSSAFFILFCFAFFDYNVYLIMMQIFLFIVMLMYLYFRACILSILEFKLNRDNDSNVIDPLLYILGLKITNKNRYLITLFFIMVYNLMVIMVIMLRRAILNKN